MLLAVQAFNVITHGAGFFHAVPMATHGDGCGFLFISMQGFAEARFILGDQARGGTKNIRRGAIVTFKTDHTSAGKILFKAQNVINLSAAPTIDRLIIITHAADVLVALGEQPQPEILGHVGILIFIDQHIFEAGLIGF